MAKQIDEKTLAILSRVTVDANKIFLTCGRLDPKQYKAVDAVLNNIGGTWNRKTQAHIFDGDPTDALEQVLLTGEIVPLQKFGYFPTPLERGERVIELAGIEQGMLVAEPQAGQGHIAELAAQIVGKENVHCYELLENNRNVLLQKGFHAQLCDFLTVEPDPIYHRIVMNPPFENQRDIDHVMHAWKFVRPGGRLVSIMASSIAFRENRKTTEFRGLLDQRGFLEHNPAGSFKIAGTMVNTVTVVMDKAK
jgi:hypothetical protein